MVGLLCFVFNRLLQAGKLICIYVEICTSSQDKGEKQGWISFSFSLFLFFFFFYSSFIFILSFQWICAMMHVCLLPVFSVAFDGDSRWET